MLIHQGLTSAERLSQLNVIAIAQMRSLVRNDSLKRLPGSSTQRRIEK